MVIRGSVRTRILRIKRIFADWLIVASTVFSPLTKVFWKGEFEGKNLFFKKGFPLIRLEKTSLKGSQLAGDRKFFQVDEAPASGRLLCQKRISIFNRRAGDLRTRLADRFALIAN